MLRSVSSETKVFLGIIVCTFVLIGGALLFFSSQSVKEEQQFSREELIAPHNFPAGNASASAYLVEFSDFECPACAAYEPAIQQIRKQYKDRLLFVYRHYPLPQHQFAEKAALAAQAAGKQGKFWERHGELFANHDKLSDETLKNIVQKLMLNEEEFTKAMNDQAVKDSVAKDKSAGNALGVNATPTFFLNGKKLKVNSPKTLIQEIEKALNGQ